MAAGVTEFGLHSERMNETVLYLSREAVEKLDLKMAEIVNVVEAAFKDKGQGKVEMPPKPGIHTRPDAFIHAMPAFLKSSEAAGMKWISGYPQNMERGMPYISGLMILNDPETGFPISVMDATWLTAMRTGAATAVAAKYLARPIQKQRPSWDVAYKADPIYRRCRWSWRTSRMFARTTSAKRPRIVSVMNAAFCARWNAPSAALRKRLSAPQTWL